jgi:hypothetical protein
MITKCQALDAKRWASRRRAHAIHVHLAKAGPPRRARSPRRTRPCTKTARCHSL